MGATLEMIASKNISPGTLGRAAVVECEASLVEQDMRVEVLEGRASLGSDALAAATAVSEASVHNPVNDSAVRGSLARARTTLQSLPSRQAGQLHRIDRSAGLPRFFVQQYESRDRAGEKALPEFLGWLATAGSDEQLLNYLQWHNWRLGQKQQSRTVRHQIEKQRADYKANIQEGVENGWLPEHALRAITAVGDVAVYIGDVHDTILQGRLGYCAQGSGYIVLAERSDLAGRGDTGSNIRANAYHEFNHAVLGSLPARWLNEAMTEHIALVMKYGDPYDTHPLRESDLTFVYGQERSLLHTVLYAGRRQVPARLAIAAYVGTGKLPKKPENLQRFRQEVDAAWGHKTTLGIIRKHLEDLEKRLCRAGRSERVAQMEAATAVSRGLRHNPEKIFGKVV